MRTTNVALEEQETTIEVDPARRQAFVFSSHAPFVRKLRQALETWPDKVTVDLETENTLGVILPADWIRLKIPSRRSDSEKAAIVNRLRKGKEVQSNGREDPE